MEQPLVSVVLPTWNRAAYLPRAIKSVLTQDYERLELIVVDDGSTDDTRQIVGAMEDGRIRYMRTPSNRGVSAARNAGIRRACGEYIAFQDSDDVWLPGKLEKQVQVLSACSADTALVYHPMSRTAEKGERRLIPDDGIPAEDRSGRLFEKLLRRNYIGAPAVCVRRSALTGPEGVGVFDTGMPILEDYELLLRLAKRYEIAYIDEVLIDTFQLSGGTNTDPRKGIVSHAMLAGKFREELKQLGMFEGRLSQLREFGRLVHAEPLAEAAIEQYCIK